MTPYQTFVSERNARILANEQNEDLHLMSKLWMNTTMKKQYQYNFEILGRPIIQYPADMIGLQELIWQVKPDLIIETGIAHGGSLILSASMLAQLDYCEAVEQGKSLDPKASKRHVLGIDIDIRAHNRQAIEQHPMAHLITMFEGSSISDEMIAKVKAFAKDYKKILICLDSNHTHEHVTAELNAYASLTSVDSYCVVFDTVVEDMPDDTFPDRPWSKGNNPKTAVWEFIKSHPEFEIDASLNNKLLLTAAPDGFLKRIK